MKQHVADNMHKIKTEITCVDHDAIGACKGLEQCLKGFEIARAWTCADLTMEFGKW